MQLENSFTVPVPVDEAWRVLNDNREILDRLATELLEKETLDHLQLAEIFADVKKLPERPQWLSSEERPLPNIPPVPMPEKPQVDEAAAAETAHADADEHASAGVARSDAADASDGSATD